MSYVIVGIPTKLGVLWFLEDARTGKRIPGGFRNKWRAAEKAKRLER